MTTLTKGTNASLTETALQVNPCSNGTITLTYSSQDFTYVSNGDTSAVCSDPTANPNPLGRGGVVTCSYTDFAHTDKGDSFTFTPNNPTKTALTRRATVLSRRPKPFQLRLSLLAASSDEPAF